MRIFYDGVIFTKQPYGGINRIYEHLTEEIPKFARDAVLREFRFPSELSDHPLLRQNYYYLPKIGGALRRLDKYVLLPTAVDAFQPDVYHTSYYRLPDDLDVPAVVTVYDMIHEHFPELFDDDGVTSARKRDCVKRADHVIAISESTKEDLIELFDTPPEKISVIYLAASPSFEPTSEDDINDVRYQYDIDGDFLLYVGRRAHYKNFMTLLEGYADWEYAGDIPLVCVGGSSEWNDEVAVFLERAGLAESVRLIGGVRDEELRAFYSAAMAFVYPSRYEGFGIPPLEAMQCGTPVIASEASSVPEVVGDAGIYVDPSDLTDIRDALSTVVEEPETRESLIEQGFERAGTFDWKWTARQTYEVYEQVND